MPGKIKKLFHVGNVRTLVERIKARMGLKFMIALAGVITLFLLLGTVVLARMFTQGQYRALETRGKEIGRFLGKTITSPLLSQDTLVLDGLVMEAIQSQDVLYVYVEDAAHKVLNTAHASFDLRNDDVKEIIARAQTDDVAVLAGRAKTQLDAIEVASDIKIGGTQIGTVKMGLSRAGVRRDARQMLLVLAGTSVMIYGGLGLMIYVLVRRMIVRPTTEALAVVSNIAAGDLSRTVQVRTKDEIGMLSQRLNDMTDGLKGMINNVREAARKTEAVWREAKDISAEITSGSQGQSESVEEVGASVNEMHFSLKEIAGSMDDLSMTSEQTSSSAIEMAASTNEVARTMTELSSAIEDTSTAILHLSAAVRQIAENVEVLSTAADETAASALEISASVKQVETSAQESAALAEEVAANAEQFGMRSIEKTIEGMSRIEAATRRTVDVINRLGERAENIGGILTVIEDITDQTGLLALNAAILAAQAGEHGKGFAVVAAEIRGLANRTDLSTQEIGKLISSVQEEAREAVGVMREEATMVAEGVRLARDAGDALRKILERADISRDMSRGISKAAAEQARGIRQVSEAVGKITEMTHQISRAANEQKIGSEQITEASEKMRELTGLVKTSTAAQAQGSKEITSAIENVNTKIGMVNRAAGEVQTGSDLIVQAIERIKEIVKANADQTVRLDSALEVMIAQSEMLQKEIEKFKT